MNHSAKLDDNAYDILVSKKKELRDNGRDGASISDAVRALKGDGKKCR